MTASVRLTLVLLILLGGCKTTPNKVSQCIPDIELTYADTLSLHSFIDKKKLLKYVTNKKPKSTNNAVINIEVRKAYLGVLPLAIEATTVVEVTNQLGEKIGTFRGHEADTNMFGSTSELNTVLKKALLKSVNLVFLTDNLCKKAV